MFCRLPRNSLLIALPVAFMALLGACSPKTPAPALRYAFLGFENLSGDPSLDWVSRGASEFLPASLKPALTTGQDAVLAPDVIGRASQTLGAHPAERAAAIVAGANRIVSGYFERTPAGIRVTASEEDEANHRTLRTLSAIASTPFGALAALAHQFSSQAAAPGTANPEAFRLFSTALTATTADAPTLLERAAALDPSFGRAWVILARTYSALGDRTKAADAVTRSRAQNIDPFDRALLDLENADLTGNRAASLAAMRKVYDLDASDSGLGRTLAAAETAAGNFSQSAEVWKKLTVNSPSDAGAWNELGYALAWSGDYSGSLAAVREYARLRPNDVNPLDSEGDVHYWFGKYADAAASYSAAYAKVPDFQNGADLYKAAWAKFRAGDKTGAQALFTKFRDIRQKAKEPAIDLLTADWLYRTGNPKDASDLLRGTGGDRPPAVRSAIANQLVIWDLLEGNRAAASKDAELSGSGITSGITPADFMVRFVAMPGAPAPEWEKRASQAFASPQIAGLRATALGYALILDGKKQAAIPIFEEVVRQAPGNDFFPRFVLIRLKGQPIQHLSAPDPANINPFDALLDKL